jgi:iron complex transport system substrate-binding protein
MSTTHLAMISALGEAGSIVGVSGTQYINDPDLKQGIRSGEIADVGADQSLNYERIVALDPDLVVAYGITAEVNGMVRRLGEIGIPVVLDGDYLENEPLGKTEWLKFLAGLYGKSVLADSLFRDIEYEYERLRGLVRGVSDKPLVMTGLPWKDVWYIPGGKSFAAAFIRDAGGEYLWADVDSREAAPVDLESVFSRGLRADIWINSGSARSLEDIRQIEPRLASFPTVKAAKVYNNTARSAPGGGNDFWERGVMEPHIVLADLIHIFHPGLLPGHKLRYYERLK